MRRLTRGKEERWDKRSENDVYVCVFTIWDMQRSWAWEFFIRSAMAVFHFNPRRCNVYGLGHFKVFFYYSISYYLVFILYRCCMTMRECLMAPVSHYCVLMQMRKEQVVPRS